MQKTVAEFKAAIAEGKITHTRFRMWCRQPIVYVYEVDHTSPTGVSLWGSFNEETPGLEELLKGRIAPLSPMEYL
jgi:hypothetical protein